MTGRTGKTLRSAAAGLFCQLLLGLLAFCWRTAVLRLLDASYLGAQGLFSNLLTALSLAELGMGSVISCALYQPLAENDLQKLRRLMTFYSRACACTGFAVLVLGLVLLPFLNRLVPDPGSVERLPLLFFLYVADSVCGYLFADRRILLFAGQQGWVDSVNTCIFSALRFSAQLVLLAATKNFAAALAAQALFTLLSNLAISRRASHLYPWLTGSSAERLLPCERSWLWQKMRAMLCHNIGQAAFTATDSLLLAQFTGLATVGLCANYQLAASLLRRFVEPFTKAAAAGVGDLAASEGIPRNRAVFDDLFLAHFWIYSFCTVCLFTLLDPFIVLWAGEGALIPRAASAAILLQFYLSGMRQPILQFRNALGLFWNDRYKPLAEAALNFILSLWLVRRFGAAGVFWGSVLSVLATSFWVEPWVVYRHYFGPGLWRYFAKQLGGVCLTAALCAGLALLSRHLFHGRVSEFLLLGAIAAGCVSATLLVIFFRSPAFLRILSRLKP